MIPYEWTDGRGVAVLDAWDIEDNQWRQLKILLIQLEKMDFHVAAGSMIFKTKIGDVYYSKINGKVALRPRCCVGPELSKEERREAQQASDAMPAKTSAQNLEVVTYLERVTKKDGVENPLLKNSRAAARLSDIESDRGRRRRVTMHLYANRKAARSKP